MTREEYIRLSDEGYFLDRRVQLIGGELIEASDRQNKHAMGVSLVQDALQQAFGPNYWARNQASLDVGLLSMPDPDLAVVVGTPRSLCRAPIPTTALLVVEVSESTLAFD